MSLENTKQFVELTLFKVPVVLWTIHTGEMGILQGLFY